MIMLRRFLFYAVVNTQMFAYLMFSGDERGWVTTSAKAIYFWSMIGFFVYSDREPKT